MQSIGDIFHYINHSCCPHGDEAVSHYYSDVLLPKNKEEEAYDKSSGLGNAFVTQEVLVRALREEKPPRVARGGLKNHCIDIQAELLILTFIIDKAWGKVG